MIQSIDTLIDRDFPKNPRENMIFLHARTKDVYIYFRGEWMEYRRYMATKDREARVRWALYAALVGITIFLIVSLLI